MRPRLSFAFVSMLVAGALACARSNTHAPRQPIVSIQIDPAEPSVAVGVKVRVTAQGIKANGQTIELDDCEWSTSEEGLVRIASTGAVAELEGLKAGETRLLVSARGIVANVPLRVSGAVPTGLEVTPAEAEIAASATAALVATGKFSDGSTRDVTSEAEWSSTAPSIASVANDAGSKGLVTGVKEGQAGIRATWSGIQAGSQITVSGATLSRVEIYPPAAVLPVQTSLQFRAVALFSDASTSDVTALADWTSSLPAIATISSDLSTRGLAQALAKGETKITATYGGLSASSLLTVTTATVKSVELDPARVQLAKGTRAELTATAIFSDNTRQDVTGQAAWASSGDAVVLDAGAPGVIKGAGEGTATVRASFLGVSGVAEVVVTSATLDSIAITPATLTLPKGTTGAFTAIGTYSDLSTQDLTPLVLWSSSDEAVATVSNAPATRGEALARKTGNATIRASLDGVFGTAALNVTAAQITALAVVPQSSALAKGTNRQLKATAAFTDATTLDVTDQADWSSSAPATASVSSIASPRGLVTGIAMGEATITAALSGKTGTATVVVTPAILVSLAIGPPDPSLPKGNTLQMTATGKYSDGSIQDITALVTWSMADTKIAVVSNATATAGLVTALQVGKTTLSATLSGQTATTSVTVTPALLVGFRVTPEKVVLEHNASQREAAVATYSDGTSLEVTNSTDWTSKDSSIASVTSGAAPRGLIAAVRQGHTTVVASFGGKTAIVDVTVNAPKMTRLELRPGSLSLPAGKQGQLGAYAVFADGSVQEVTAKATWSSSAPAVVVGNGASGGQVNARAVGTATVTATLSGLSATAQVTVTSPLVDTLSISPTSARVPAGVNQPLRVRAFFTDGTSQDVTDDTNFISADTAIVGLNGNVAFGVREGGPVAVTARYGGLSAVAQITVGPAVLMSIVVSPNGMVLDKGETGSFTATGTYSDGTTRNVTAQAAWASSVLSVCTVNLGQVKALGGGKSTITASLNGISGSATVEVLAPTITRIAIAPPNAILRPNLIYPYKAWALYSDGTTRDITTTSTWTSTNPQIAEQVNYTGYWGLWAKGVGVADVRVTYGGSSGTTRVQVYNSNLTGVEISPAELKLPIGVAAKLSGVFTYSDGWAVEIQNPQWRSNNEAVAKIDLNGVVTGVSAGSTMITMLAHDAQTGTEYSTTAKVTVTSAQITAITLQVPPRMAAGLSTQLSAIGTFSDGSRINLGPSTLWSTSDAGVATVMPDLEGARLTAKAGGSASVTGSFNGVSATAPLSVTASTLQTLELTIAQPKLALGATSPVSVAGAYSDGSRIDLTSSVEFDSSAPDIALVALGVFGNAKSPYLIASSSGAATVRATLGGVSTSKPVTVSGATLSSIALAVGNGPPSANLTLSGSGPFGLRAVGTFSDGSQSDVTVMCSFAPGKVAPGVVATISNVYAGQVTVIGSGSETVSATYAPFYIGQPSVKGTATLTVP